MPNNEVKETERQHFGGKMVADWDNLGQEDTELALGYSEVLVRLPTGYTDEWKSVVGCFKRRCRLERHGGPGLPANGTMTNLDSLETGMSGAGSFWLRQQLSVDL
jgi:hypothetical protein